MFLFPFSLPSNVDTHPSQMEAMEVDLPAVAPGPSSSSQPPAVTAGAAAVGTVQLIISDSGSSTEVEDEDGDGSQTAARVPPRPPPTWAFSQRAVSSSSAPVNSAGADGPIRRRIRSAERTRLSGHCGYHAPEVTLCLYARYRQGLRVHYPSQTAAPSRGFPDFLLRAPAASVAQPESGSTTEVSDSDDEEEQDRGGVGEEGPPAAAADPPPPPSPRISESVQQDAGLRGECLRLCVICSVLHCSKIPPLQFGLVDHCRTVLQCTTVLYTVVHCSAVVPYPVRD